jgi:hypothetical protein
MIINVSSRRTIEYADRHIPASIFPTTAAILSGLPALVKVYRNRLLATNTGLHNSIMAATDRACEKS